MDSLALHLSPSSSGGESLRESISSVTAALAEVAGVFDVTPSRVSQILSEARKDLRRALDGNVSAGDLEYREAL